MHVHTYSKQKKMLVGSEALGEARFGSGTGRIWLDSVQCMGTERALSNCVANSSGINSCMHTQDAGVRCPPGKTKLLLQLFNAVLSIRKAVMLEM